MKRRLIGFVLLAVLCGSLQVLLTLENSDLRLHWRWLLVVLDWPLWLLWMAAMQVAQFIWGKRLNKLTLEQKLLLALSYPLLVAATILLLGGPSGFIKPSSLHTAKTLLLLLEGTSLASISLWAGLFWPRRFTRDDQPDPLGHPSS